MIQSSVFVGLFFLFCFYCKKLVLACLMFADGCILDFALNIEVMNRILSAYLWVICAHLELLVFSPPINIGISHKHGSHKC